MRKRGDVYAGRKNPDPNRDERPSCHRTPRVNRDEKTVAFQIESLQAFAAFLLACHFAFASPYNSALDVSGHVGFTHRRVRSPRLLIKSSTVARVYKGKRIIFVAEQSGIYKSNVNSGYLLGSIRDPNFEGNGCRCILSVLLGEGIKSWKSEAHRDTQFFGRVHLNESGLWFSAPKSVGPGYVTDGSEFPPQSAPLQSNIVNAHASNKRLEVDVLKESASSTLIGVERGDGMVEVGGEIGADVAGGGDGLVGWGVVWVSIDHDRALGRLGGKVRQCLDSIGDADVDVEGTYRGLRS